MQKEPQHFPVIVAVGFIIVLIFGSFGLLVLLKRNGLPSTSLGTNTSLPESTPQLQLDSQKKYEIPTDLKGLLTPTPGTNKINFEPDLTPTPTPNPIFGEGTDIKIKGLN